MLCCASTLQQPGPPIKRLLLLCLLLPLYRAMLLHTAALRAAPRRAAPLCHAVLTTASARSSMKRGLVLRAGTRPHFLMPLSNASSLHTPT
jgi:hypothetical protein